MTDAQRVHDALLDGTLGPDDLTARRLGAFLGATTSRLYHRYGSLHGFLMAVAQVGFGTLAELLLEAEQASGLEEVAAAYVAFGLDHPALYGLMFEHPYDWEALREAGAFEGSPGVGLWEVVVQRLETKGHADPAGDARLLYATLHGLVSLARSGRANLGDLSVPDRETALASARALPARLCPRSAR